MLDSLLNLMSDGQFHSGERLGAELGISRAAVWKMLKPLAEEGFPIQRIRGRGYRVPSGAAMLNEARIRECMPAELAGRWEWHLSDRIDSTNAQAQRLIAKGAPRPLVCISEQQSSGRGRRGREWSSPFAQNIYMTAVEPFEGGAQSLEGLSLVVGLALVESLGDCGYQGCQLKWPNDVLLGGKKLAGVLVEISGDLSADCYAVIGVGVNVLMTEAENIEQAWTSLLISGQRKQLNRNAIIAAFVCQLAASLELFRKEGFAPFAARWMGYDAWAREHVRVVSGNSSLEGTNLGLTERGALRLQTHAGEVHVNGGEVSLRLNDAS